MRVFIYTGGKIYPDLIQEKPVPGDYVIAADSGYQNAFACKIKPDLLIGDFDSLLQLPETVGEVIRALPEKDYTDTQLAVEKALAKQPQKIVIIGGTGERLDHALSTISILEYLDAQGIPALLTNGQNRVHFLKSDKRKQRICLVPAGEYHYFGVIALSAQVHRLSLQGCKYPVEEITLSRTMQFAVSNEVTANYAQVSCGEGTLLVIETQDI